jgi:hypothetical protein
MGSWRSRLAIALNFVIPEAAADSDDKRAIHQPGAHTQTERLPRWKRGIERLQSGWAN